MLRLLAEKDAEELVKLLERGEVERRTYQEQTDVVRGELSAAEARAADLQAKFDALEKKHRTASPDGTLWQQHATQRIKELERQLEVAKVAGSGRGKSGAPSPRKRSWWWPF